MIKKKFSELETGVIFLHLGAQWIKGNYPNGKNANAFGKNSFDGLPLTFEIKVNSDQTVYAILSK